MIGSNIGREGALLVFWKEHVWLQIRPSWRRWVVPIWSVLLLIVAWQISAAATPRANSGPAADAEMLDRASIRSAVIEQLQEGAFAVLDAMADQFRDHRSETASGVRKLSIFYAAIHERAARLDRDDKNGWDSLLDSLARWQAFAPQSPAAVISTAIVLKRRAWMERPRSTIVEISNRAEALFLARLDFARRYLDANATIGARDPHYFVVLAELATAQNEAMDRLVEIVDQGLALDPDYHRIAAAGLNYFAPFAAGNPAQSRRLQAYANGVTARASVPDASYARLYWHAAASGYARAGDFDWLRVVRGMDAILARNDVSWNRENLARLACLAGDHATSRRLLGAARDDRVGDGIWASPQLRTACKG